MYHEIKVLTTDLDFIMNTFHVNVRMYKPVEITLQEYLCAFVNLYTSWNF